MAHVHNYTRSKPDATVETCHCGAFRHTEHSGPTIAGMDLTTWLSCLPKVHAVSDVTSIKIKRTRYTGCWYYQNNEWRFYALGTLPACYRRSSHTCFRFSTEWIGRMAESWAKADRDYYIAGYFQDAPTEHHPFGPHFLIFRWDVPFGTKIDQYEQRPYERVLIS